MVGQLSTGKYSIASRLKPVSYRYFVVALLRFHLFRSTNIIPRARLSRASTNLIPKVFESAVFDLQALADLLQFPINIVGGLFNQMGETLSIGDLILTIRTNRLKIIWKDDVE